MLTKLSLLAVAAGGMASCRVNKVHAATSNGNEPTNGIKKKIRPSEVIGNFLLTFCSSILLIMKHFVTVDSYQVRILAVCDS